LRSANVQWLPNRLYRNRGDGTFGDVTARAGLLSKHVGKGMSVAFGVSIDGRVDVFVTNDTVRFPVSQQR
jgi:hypothetical protein